MTLRTNALMKRLLRWLDTTIYQSRHRKCGVRMARRARRGGKRR